MHQITTLSHDDAWKAITAIRDEITKRGKAAVITVADPQGELIALLRMDGVKLPSLNIAINKAFTAARNQASSKSVGERVRDPERGHDIAYMGDPRFVGWGGGVPVIVNGQCVGSVAVSGLPETEDMELVEMGVKAILATFI